MNNNDLNARYSRLKYILYLFIIIVLIKTDAQAMQQLTLAEQMLYSTVKIICLREDGVQDGRTGTGFFMDFAVKGSERVPAIVTNKHVVKDAYQVRIFFHVTESDRPYPSGKVVFHDINATSDAIFEHPDPNVDLCAIPIASIRTLAREAKTPIFTASVSLEIIPEEKEWQDFDAIEDVTMIGYPDGIADDKNNLPLVRRGITATPLGKAYNGEQEFMVDMACFPGASGSPVFLYDRGSYFDRKTNSIVIGNRFHLLGILYVGRQISNRVQRGFTPLDGINVPTMMHLGNVIKATQLRILDAEIRRKIADSQNS